MGDTQRKIDVTVSEDEGPTAVEVKIGRQALTSRTKAEIAGDVELQEKGYQTVWEFMPNGKGVTSPSQPLLDALNEAGIDANIYLPSPTGFPITVPGDSPAPLLPPEEISGGLAPSDSGDGGSGSGGDEGVPAPPD